MDEQEIERLVHVALEAGIRSIEEIVVFVADFLAIAYHGVPGAPESLREELDLIVKPLRTMH